ncbi:MAG: tetratricopeptide repeat protein [PVC group bacterium]
MGKRRIKNILDFNFLPVAVLVVSGFVVYAGSLGNCFVWDDENLVVENHSIRSPAAVPGFFAAGLFRGIRGNFYRPLQALSYAADYQCWGVNPFGYHLSNLLLHIVNSVLVLRILTMIGGRRPIAFLAALVFLIHPVQTEAVAYVSGRADLLAAFFVLLSLFFFLAEKENAGSTPSAGVIRRGFLFLSAVCFLLALLSKESSLVLPLLVLLGAAAISRKKGGGPGASPAPAFGRYVAALFLIALLYLAARAAVFRSGTVPLTSNPYPFYERFLTGWKVLLLYLKVLLIPVGLRMERVVSPAGSFFSPSVLGPAIFLSGAALAVLRARRRFPLILFGIAWFGIGLLPYLNWFPLNAEMAEHWLYLPSAGFFLLVALAMETCLFRPGGQAGSRPSAVVVILSALVFFSALTIRRNLDWKDNPTIYRATARRSPGSPRARYNLGNTYLAEGRLDEAEREYREALRLKPRDAACRRNLGNTLLRLHRVPEAVREYETAVSLDPGRPVSLSLLGAAYGLAGRSQDALRVLQRALEIDPLSPSTHNNLGSIYTRLGRFDEAEKAYGKALELQPEMVEAVFNLGVVYYRQGRLPESAARMNEALRLSPGYPPALTWREKIEREEGVNEPEKH